MVKNILSYINLGYCPIKTTKGNMNIKFVKTMPITVEMI